MHLADSVLIHPCEREQLDPYLARIQAGDDPSAGADELEEDDCDMFGGGGAGQNSFLELDAQELEELTDFAFDNNHSMEEEAPWLNPTCFNCGDTVSETEQVCQACLNLDIEGEVFLYEP